MILGRQFVLQYDSAVLTLQPGEISEPVRTDFGYYLIELLEKDNTTFSSRHILMKTILLSLCETA